MGSAGSKRPTSRCRWGSAAASEPVGSSSGWMLVGFGPVAAAAAVHVVDAAAAAACPLLLLRCCSWFRRARVWGCSRRCSGARTGAADRRRQRSSMGPVD